MYVINKVFVTNFAHLYFLFLTVSQEHTPKSERVNAYAHFQDITKYPTRVPLFTFTNVGEKKKYIFSTNFSEFLIGEKPPKMPVGGQQITLLTMCTSNMQSVGRKVMPYSQCQLAIMKRFETKGERNVNPSINEGDMRHLS